MSERQEPRKSLDELAQEQGVKPVSDVSELVSKLPPEDMAEFVAAVRSLRESAVGGDEP